MPQLTRLKNVFLILLQAQLWAPACSGHKVPREARVVRGEAPGDAPVPVPGEPVSDARGFCFLVHWCAWRMFLVIASRHCFPTCLTSLLFQLKARA